MKTRKTPQRMCLGCGEHKDKPQLVRVVRSPEGDISIDRTGKKSGRGAYVCQNVGCLQKARKAKRLERALGCQIPDDVYEALEKELDGT